MEKYNYYEAVREDVRTAIEEYSLNDFNTIEEFEEKLNEDLWVNDCVTGNGSGSYTFNQWAAEENLCHNWDLLMEVYESFGYDSLPADFTPESGDVVIRCYLLSQAIEEVVQEVWEEKEEEEEEN